MNASMLKKVDLTDRAKTKKRAEAAAKSEEAQIKRNALVAEGGRICHELRQGLSDTEDMVARALVCGVGLG